MAGELDDERAVLGDELQQRGDPQGELIGLQLALEALPPTAPPARRNLIEAKVAALLDHHHDAIYGALAPHVTRLSRPDPRDPALLVKAWRGGFADTIWVQRTRASHALVEVIRDMRMLPIAYFVRRIELGAGDHVAALAALDPLPSLRELVLLYETDPAFLSVRLSDTELITPWLAQLEVLEIQYAITVSAPLSSPQLRKLDVYTSSGVQPTVLFDGALPVLADLTAYGFLVDDEFFARYPMLRRLTLRTQLPAGWFADALRVGAFAKLDALAITSLRDADLRLIAEHRDQFAAMTKLDLSGNYFTPEARAAVANRLPRCLRFR